MNTKKIIKKTFLTILSITVLLQNHNLVTTKAEETLETLQGSEEYLLSEEQRLNTVLNALKNDDSNRSEYVKVLEEQIDVLERQIDVQNKRTTLLDKEIKQKEILIDTAQSKIKEHFEKFKQRIRAIFKAGGDTALVAVVLKTNTIQDFANAAQVAQVIGKHDTKLINDLNEEMTILEDEKLKIENKKKEFADLRESLEGKRKDLEKIQEDNKKILEERRQQALRAASLNSSNIFHSEYVGKSPNVSGNGMYIWPLPGYNMITSYWGDGRGHKGIDISGSGVYGAAIVAAADGTVTIANGSNEWGGGYGYYVKIDHGAGHATVYAHCSLVTANVGQVVKAGEIIGYVGNTGNSYGAHLHFETWKDGSRYDPMSEF